MLALLSVVLVIAAVGASLFWLTRGETSAAPPAESDTSLPPSTASTAPTDVTAGATSPTTVAPTPVPAQLTSEAALSLTDEEARTVLSRWQTRDAPRVAGLAGSWVPQVSSKCTGIPVDLGPGFMPDGQIDEPSVTIQQILALQVVLGDRYDAVLTTADDLGVDQKAGTVCASRVIWVALVSETSSSPGGAHGWCRAAGYSVDECAARLVVPPGQSGTRLDLAG